MPELIQCPSCNRKLRVPDNLIGKKVKCPSCGTAFTAKTAEEELPTAPLIEEEEAPKAPPRKAPRPRDEAIEERSEAPRRRRAPPPPDDEDEDETESDDFEEEDRPRRRRRPVDEEDDEEERPRRSGGRMSWAKVRQGITFILISICVLIGGQIISFIGGMIIGIGAGVSAAQAGRGGAQVAPVVAMGGGMLAILGFSLLMQFVSQVLTLVGYFFCMSAPRKYNARTLALTTLILAGAHLLLTILAVVFGLASGVGVLGAGIGGLGGISGGAAVMNLLGSLCYWAKFLTFLLFIIAVARCLRARALEKNTKNLAILYGIGVAGGVVMVVLTIAFAGAALAGAAGGGAGFGAAAGGGAMALVVCGCAMVLVLIAIAIWYIVVLVQTRGVLGDYLARH